MAINPTVSKVGDNRDGFADSELLRIVLGKMSFKLPKKTFGRLQTVATWGVIATAAYIAGGYMATTELDRMTVIEKMNYHRQAVNKLEREIGK